MARVNLDKYGLYIQVNVTTGETFVRDGFFGAIERPATEAEVKNVRFNTVDRLTRIPRPFNFGEMSDKKVWDRILAYRAKYSA